MPSQTDRNDLGKSFGCFVRWIARWSGEMKKLPILIEGK